MDKKTKMPKVKPPLAFYEPPACVKKTSAEIISEARAAMMMNTASGGPAMKAVNTKRPYTPRDNQRTLFGRGSFNSHRPPSSFSLRYLQYQDGIDSTENPRIRNATHLIPMSAGRGRTDLDASTFRSSWAGGRLPSVSRLVDAQDFKRKRRHQFRAAASLDNLPEELETERVDPATPSTYDVPARNAYSSPKEHTQSLDSPGVTLNTTTTPRKVMKHDTNALSQSTSGIMNLKHKSLNPSLTSRSPAQIMKELGPRDKAALSNIERTIFGSRKNERDLQNIDKGAFGDSLYKTDAFGITELDKAGAIYDNQINEAKLADNSDKLNLSSAQHILKQLNELAESCKGDASDIAVIPLLDALYSALNQSSNSRKGSVSSKLKSQVLKTMYRFVEHSEDALLLKLARIILCLPVTGSNLAGVCKLVFKVSRNDKNDHLFLQGNILDLFVDALGCASPLEDAEACVYGYGALKFLTMNNELLNRVVNLGILDLMVLHLKIINTVRAEGGRIPEQTSHAVFQLTGALRNISGEERLFPELVNRGAIAQLCHSMELFSTDLDLITNIARTLSIISTNEECCFAIVEYENFMKTFSKLFLKYPGRQDIVVRLGYALGNILAKSDKSRLQLLETEGAMSALLNLLQLYLDKDLQLASQDAVNINLKPEVVSDGSVEIGSDGSIEDVMVKIIRIIANMSMNMEVGERLTCLPSNDDQSVDNPTRNQIHLNKRDTALGERIVILLLAVLRRKSVLESAELLLSTLSTLNNLTFYPSGSNHSIFQNHMMDLSQSLCALLSSNLDECQIETTKVLGNLTRCKPARDFLLETGGLNLLLRFLKTDNHELISTTTGVLVNLMADGDQRISLRNSQGVSKLIRVLVSYGEGDWPLASLVCQVLWNFCIDTLNLNDWLGPDETNQLLEILVDFLDEDRLFGSTESESASNFNRHTLEYHGGSGVENMVYHQWEEFAVIATNLLEKIENSLDDVHPVQQLPINHLNIGTSAREPTENTNFNPWEELTPPTM